MKSIKELKNGCGCGCNQYALCRMCKGKIKQAEEISKRIEELEFNDTETSQDFVNAEDLQKEIRGEKNE